MSARKGRLFVVLVRIGLGVYLMVLRAALRLPQRRLPGRVDVLATGSFVSQNWLRAHLQPLAAAQGCRTVWMVATRPVPDIPNVHPIYPWRWLSRTTGDVPARLLTFAVAAVRLRPHVVAGFHLLFNGLAAALVATGGTSLAPNKRAANMSPPSNTMNSRVSASSGASAMFVGSHRSCCKPKYGVPNRGSLSGLVSIPLN